MHTDFEKRYQRPPLARTSERVQAAMRAAAQEQLARQRRRPGRPQAMAWYEEVVAGDARRRELLAFPGKVIGTFCYFVPEELIYAAGALPVRLCAGHADAIATAEEALPRDICPLVKSSFGAALAGGSWFEACDAVVVPTTCDAKTKLGEYLADHLPVWMLNLPRVKDYETVKAFWTEELKRLKAKLEQATGVAIDRKRLKAAILLLQRRSKLYRRLYEARRLHPGALSHQDWLLVVQSTFYADPQVWLDRTEQLLKELEAADAPAPPIKLLLTGAPMVFPNFKILNIVEELGAAVVADEMCSGQQRLWDYAEPDEWTLDGMLEAVVSRSLFPSTCPCFASSYDRIDKLLALAQEFKVDGVIYHDLRLCQVFDLERDLVNQVLKEKRIPMLTLHTDYGQEDVEQIRTRAEAFLEMLR